MKMIKDLKLKPKLVSLFLLAGLIPLLLISFLVSHLVTNTLMDKSFDQFLLSQAAKKNQIEAYFRDQLTDLKILANSRDIAAIYADLSAYHSKKQILPDHPFPIDNEEYAALHLRNRDFFDAYINAFAYREIFIICEEHGHVMFTLNNKAAAGTNLRHGQHNNSNLSKLWQAVKERQAYVFIDFSDDSLSDGQESAYLGYPFYDQNGNMAGVLALQLGPETINQIMDSRDGMGETGETYLVAYDQLHRRYEFRSNMQTMGAGKYVVGASISPTEYWLDAFDDNKEDSGKGLYLDSIGGEVLIAYDKIDVQDISWALISKISKTEVTAPIRDLIDSILLSGLAILLGLAISSYLLARNLSRPILNSIRFAESISKGDLEASLGLHQGDELGNLAEALNSMAGNLRALDWLKRGKEGLDDELRGDHDIQQLAERFIGFVTRHFAAQLGALYLADAESDKLRLVASHAFSDRRGHFTEFAVGEGLVGQAAWEKQILYFSHVEDQAPALNYGVAETDIAHFVIAPLVFEDQVLAVFLVGSQAPFTPLQKTLLEQNLDNIAILFNAAKSRKLIDQLLQQAKQQQEELRVTNEGLEAQARQLRESEAQLQAQQEELRVSNEELEEQTKKLRESEALLQAQQEELRVINEELEERSKALEEQSEVVKNKNRALLEANQSVEKKARDLERASQYKTEFLANMSHELRTPLNSILILSQLLTNNKEVNLTEKQLEYSQTIHNSGTNLLNLINDILDLSKIEAGKMEILVEEVSPIEVAHEMESLFVPQTLDKGIEFVVDCSPELPTPFLSDRQKLQQIVKNLISNAIKFTSKGSVALRISTPSAETIFKDESFRARPVIAFTVEDTGIGIPLDKQDAVFEAFQQVDGTSSRKFGGTGLGLSISREFTRLLEGELQLQSEPDKGSRFTVYLPSLTPVETIPAPEPPVVEAKVTAETPVAGESGSRFPGSKPPATSYVEDDRKELHENDRVLLIIEDDRDFARVLRDLARERGFKCLVAGDGESGLHFADYYNPSAAIIDLGLPGIDGLEVIKRLKASSVTRHIPVHIISCRERSANVMSMGAIGFLTKPVAEEDLFAAFGKIEQVISKKMKKLLVVEDDKIQRDSIIELVGDNDVDSKAVATAEEAYQALCNDSYDCMILDLGLKGSDGYQLLDRIKQSPRLADVPIIIYTGRELTQDEEMRLKRSAESIIIKGAHSPERLLDETTLFLHRVETQLPDAKQKMLRSVQSADTGCEGKLVLVVDDDMRNVFALSSVLEENGMQVIVGKNGREGLGKLDSVPGIDLVLMDIMMPEMDGYEAMRHIRKNSKFRKLPIIALTAKAMKGDRDKCIQAGANDYLSKPVDTKKLLSLLRVWLYS
ncbi:MAG: response regulator [Desulfuromonadaceae bacterium]|nr:response regulator [Desulfuromonadaceae bacterium]